jgi:hypothetical protein
MRYLTLLLSLALPLPALAQTAPTVPATIEATSPIVEAIPTAETVSEDPSLPGLLCRDHETCPCEVFAFTYAKPAPQPVAKPLPALW